MVHKWWTAWSVAYAEGNLAWPLVILLQRHCRNCPQCQQLVRSEMAFMNALDASLYHSRHDLVHTIAGFTQKQLIANESRTRLPLKTIAVLAATLLLFIGGWQLRLLWPTSVGSNAIYASSSCGTNVVEEYSVENATSSFVYYSDSHGNS